MQPLSRGAPIQPQNPEPPQLNFLVKKFLDLFTGSLKDQQPAAEANLRNKITDITPLQRYIENDFVEMSGALAPYAKVIGWNFFSNIANKIAPNGAKKMTPEEFIEKSKKLFGDFCAKELAEIDGQGAKHNFAPSINHFFANYLPVGLLQRGALKLAMPLFQQEAEEIYNDLPKDKKERIQEITSPIFDIFKEAPPPAPEALKREEPKPVQPVRRFKLPPVTKDEELSWVVLKGAKIALGALQGILSSQANEAKSQLKDQIQDFDLLENFMQSQFDAMRQTLLQKELLHTTKAQQQLKEEITSIRPNAVWAVIGNIAKKVIKPGEKISTAEFNTRAQAFLQTFAVEKLKEIQAGELNAETLKPVIMSTIQTFYPITGPLKTLLNLFMGRIANDVVKVYKSLMNETAGMTNEQRVQYVLFPYLEVLQTYLPKGFEDKIELPPAPAPVANTEEATIPRLTKDRVKVLKGGNRFSNFFKNLWNAVRNTFSRIFSKAP